MGNAEQRQTELDESYLDELPPGTELLQGQFKIVQFLNSGGFGITYLAVDSLDRKVVIKECFPSSFCNRSRSIVQARSRAHTAELKSVVELFVQEARSLAKLDHPNIVGVHQVFEDNETAYMVLDFIQGRDLLDTLEDEDHGLTGPQIKGILKDVLGAVQFIHSQDILHRDISPDNILLDENLRPVLIDFGAAREEATKKSRVLSALRVVKDGYSPQEFYIQGSEQTPSSDLYALGASFYHLIAGEIPPNSQARLAAIASGEPDIYKPLAGRIKGFDNKFLATIDTALGILPKDRMQSAEEWLSAMEGGRRKSRVVTQQVPMSSAAAASQIPEQKSRLVPLLGSVAVLALLAVGGLAYTGKLPSSVTDAFASVTAAGASDISVPDSVAPESVAAVEEPVVAEPVVAEPETVVAEAVAPEVAAPQDNVESPIVNESPAVVEEPAVAESVDVVEEPAVIAGMPQIAPSVAPPGTPLIALTESDPMPEADITEADIATVPAEIAEAVPATDEITPEIAEFAAGDVEDVPAGVLEDVGTVPTDEIVEEVVTADIVAEDVAPVEEEAPIVAEAETIIEAPQPEVAPEPEAFDFLIEETPAPIQIAEATPDLRPLPNPLTNALTVPTQDDVESVAEAGLDIAAPAPTIVAEVAPEPTVEETQTLEADASILGTQLQFGLPFEGETDSNVIAKSADVAPIWVAPGARILAVNGVEIERISDIDTVLAGLVTPNDDELMLATFTVKSEGEEAAATHSWSLPVKHVTTLPDGTAFQTSMVNGNWQTKVTAISNTAGELQVGDVIVAYVSSSEPITDYTKLREILTRELENGTSQFNFAVTREGSMWVVALNYAEGA